MESNPHKSLQDFPKFTITAMSRSAEPVDGEWHYELLGSYDPSLEDIFSEIMREERLQWFWLLFGERQCFTPRLKSIDKTSKTAELVCEYDEELDLLGSELAYLSSYWQPFHVWMVSEPLWRWQRQKFAGASAIAEDYEAPEASMIDGREIKIWTSVVPVNGESGQSRYYPAKDQSLPVRSGTRIVPNMWDHEHCQLCNANINDGMFGYIDPNTRWVCENCYGRYVEKHNLAFVDEL